MLPMLLATEPCFLSITARGQIKNSIGHIYFSCIVFVDVYICPLGIRFNWNDLSIKHIFCRTNPFEFIVHLQTYLKSTLQDYPIGTRVQMQHEVEESLRR